MICRNSKNTSVIHFIYCFIYYNSYLFVIYGFLLSMALILVFTVFLFVRPASRILQILDHVGIYMVIAGTLTPFCLITLNHHTSARVLIIAEWTFAILGSIFAC